MKKLFCLWIALMLMAATAVAAAKGPADPHMGDVGGVISKKIEKAIREGRDPSVYVNVPKPTPTDPPYVSYYFYGQSSTKFNPNVVFIDSPSPAGISVDVFQLFREHALKWYNYSTNLQREFGNFSAYFAYAVSAETNNYYRYNANKMTLDAYMKMVIYTNKMPYHS